MTCVDVIGKSYASMKASDLSICDFRGFRDLIKDELPAKKADLRSTLTCIRLGGILACTWCSSV